MQFVTAIILWFSYEMCLIVKFVTEQNTHDKHTTMYIWMTAKRA